MSQKTFGILFIIILILVSGGIIISKFQEPSPLPSPSGLQFNSPIPVSSQSPTISPSPEVKPPFPLLNPDQIKGKTATIKTDRGDIQFELYPEATMASSNFIHLAQTHFYDGLTFHRVEPGFVIQGGDPEGNGRGGPGYTFPDEPVIGNYYRGIVAMANAGPNTNGSQFFILLADHPELPPNYTIFGKVTSGMEVVDKIAVGDKMTSVTISR